MKAPRRGLVIGPSDAGADVDVVVRRAPEDHTASTAPQRVSKRASKASRPARYAHINRWHLNDRGATADDAAARLIADALGRQPGFVSYALVRTGAREVVAVTVFETQAQLLRAMQAVAPLRRRHLLPLVATKPERAEGVVLHYRAAG